MSKFKFTWGHGVVVALGSFMIFILSLIFLAGNMGEMIEDDYYEKTLKYQDDIDAARRANTMTARPEIVRQANGYLIKFNEAPQEGKVLFLRPNNSEEDIAKELKLNSRNELLISSAELKTGDYEVSIRWKQNDEDYLIKETVRWKDPS